MPDTTILAERVPPAAAPDGLDAASLFADPTRRGQPLPGYAAIALIYNLAFAVFLITSRATGRGLPQRIAWSDILLIGLATFRLSRLLSKDKVTTFLRAPFTRFVETCGEGEVNEEPRGEGVRHAVGELLTCPFCLGMWAATLLAYGLVLSPPLTRLIASILAANAVANFCHLAYGGAALSVNREQEGN